MNASLQNVDAALHDTTRPWHVLFGWAEARSGVHRLKLLMISAAAVCGYMVTGYGTAILSNVIGFAYPAYVTIGMTLQNPHHAAAAEEQAVIGTQSTAAVVPVSSRWLTYWLIFSSILLVEQVCGQVLRMLPFYFLVKSVFLVWCFLPIESNGSAYVYATVIRRYFRSRFAGTTDY